MATATQSIEVKKTEGTEKAPTGAGILDEIRRMHDAVVRRAHEIFESNGGQFGRDLEDWLTAKRELLWEPAIELTEQDNAFRLRIAVSGVDPKDVEVRVTPDQLLVQAESKSEKDETQGTVHVCEISRGRLFRSIDFLKKVDPDKVKAEMRNGMLSVTAPLAAAVESKQVKVAAS